MEKLNKSPYKSVDLQRVAKPGPQEIDTMKCSKCGKMFSGQVIKNGQSLPRLCPKCVKNWDDKKSTWSPAEFVENYGWKALPEYKTRNCSFCGKSFKGYSTEHICPECADLAIKPKKDWWSPPAKQKVPVYKSKKLLNNCPKCGAGLDHVVRLSLKTYLCHKCLKRFRSSGWRLPKGWEIKDAAYAMKKNIAKAKEIIDECPVLRRRLRPIMPEEIK